MNSRDRSRSIQTEQSSAPPSTPLAAIRVEAVSGPGKGAKKLFPAGLLIIGSHPTCDLLVRDPSVSKRHLSLELLPGFVSIQDLGSRNGTWYLGVRMKEGRVPVGASLRIGRTTLRFLPAQESEPLSERDELHGLLGRSVAMKRLYAVLEKLGPADMTVLIRGETGVGKEAVARVLHALSPRREGPFIVFDCASVSPHLVESELFGHVKGAFTGAKRDHPGALATAQGGTLFLAALGDLPPSLQPKFLRVLESKEYRPVGGAATLRADVRLIASVRHDRDAESSPREFRSDLFFRVAQAVVDVPPLRDRADDIPVLAEHFARQLGRSDTRFDPATLAALQCDPWPGNVRELRSTVERVLALGHARAHDGLGSEEQEKRYRQVRAEVVLKFERAYLIAILAKTQGSITRAARHSGLSRVQLYRMIRRHRLRPADWAGPA